MSKVAYIALALSALLLGGCGNVMKNVQVAQSQVATFHQQLNNQNVNAILSTADANLFRQTPKDDFTKLLAVIHKKLGKVTDSKTQRYSFGGTSAVMDVDLVQNTTFEHGKGIESFTFRVEGGKAYLSGYTLNSSDLK